MTTLDLTILLDAAMSLRRLSGRDTLGFKFTTEALDEAINSAVTELHNIELEVTGPNSEREK